MASKKKLEEKKKRAEQRKHDRAKKVVDTLMGKRVLPKARVWGHLGTEV